MKTKLLLLFIFTCMFTFGQDSLNLDLKLKSTLITFNPAKIVKNTTGINLGIMDDYEHQTINGINLQANPIFLLYPLIPKAIPAPTEANATVVVNGIHFSTGGMTDGKQLNGLGISMYHHSMETNGISVNFYNNTSTKLNGVYVSGFANNSAKGRGINISVLANHSEDFKGLLIGAFNSATKMKGLQIGISNQTENMKGIQVGIVNKNKNGRNFQIGLWNKNAKRTLPILNF